MVFRNSLQLYYTVFMFEGFLCVFLSPCSPNLNNAIFFLFSLLLALEW